MADSETEFTEDVFRPFEKLVEITVLGKTFLVPEKNSLLRAFQFISPETIPYGRFCWNQDCQYCRVGCQLSDEDHSRPILSCKFIVSEGMTLSNLSPELVGCLRTKLGIDASSINAGTNSGTNAGTDACIIADNTDNCDKEVSSSSVPSTPRDLSSSDPAQNAV